MSNVRRQFMSVTNELRMQVRARREPSVWLDGKLVPGSVPFLRELATLANNDLERDELLGELAGEYLRADLDNDHLLVQRERVKNHPAAAVKLLGLAHSLSMRKDGAIEAKLVAAQAVRICLSQGTLIRYALVCQAEVARSTNDSALFEQALAELIADAPNSREEDYGLSVALVSALPVGFCSAELERKYRGVLGRDA